MVFLAVNFLIGVPQFGKIDSTVGHRLIEVSGSVVAHFLYQSGDDGIVQLQFPVF